MGSMNTVLQVQPSADTTDRSPIALDPARRTRLSSAARERSRRERPVRVLSLALALAVGTVIGALLAMSAADHSTPNMSGNDIMTEVDASVAP